MDLGLGGRIALVAGASSGLGRAVARELAMEGAQVALLARREHELERVAQELGSESGQRVIATPGDVTDAEQTAGAVQRATRELGAIDILVANAGGPPASTFESTTETQYRAALELNLLSSIRLAKLCAPSMRRRAWGRMIFLSGLAAKQPLPYLILSNTARAGLLGFAKTLATELAPDNVLVNTVLTGHFDTDRAMSLAAQRSAREGRSVDELLRERRQAVPMGRAGHPPELAALVAFLASERGSFITGTAIPVDGGQSSSNA
jgi:3-oxoacyl-[acyl-carrier protein] reductase